MAGNNYPLILLDLQDEYRRFEDRFNPEIFYRFTDKNQCLQHVTARPANNRTLHFFIPKSEHTIIGQNINFSNTICYIYCMDNQDITEMNQSYQCPSLIRIINANSLLMNLGGANIQHCVEQADRTQHEPDEHDMALEAGVELCGALIEQFREHIIFQIGVQPED